MILQWQKKAPRLVLHGARDTFKACCFIMEVPMRLYVCLLWYCSGASPAARGTRDVQFPKLLQYPTET